MSAPADGVFVALADPTRWRVLSLLAERGEGTATSLAGAVWGCVPQPQEAGSVYLAITGGAASPGTQQIDEIEDVVWTDRMPECLWKFRVRDSGPLFVAIEDLTEE